MKMNKIFFLAVCLVVLGAAAAAAPTSPQIVSAKLSAMGGASPALTGQGVDTLATNPAAFAFESKSARIAGLNLALSGPFSDVMNIAQLAGSGSSEDITDAVLDSVRKNSGIYFGANMTGPLSLAYVSKNFGLGIFNRTYVSAGIASLTYSDLFIGEELLLTGGYGFKVIDARRHELALGIQAKAFWQAESELSGTVASMAGSLLNFSLDSIPARSAAGIGVDLGILYRFAGSLSLGVVIRDIYTPVFYSCYDSVQGFLDAERTSSGITTLERDLQAGIGWQPRIPSSWRVLTGLTLAAGIRDLLNVCDPTARNPVLNVSLGMEAVLFKILALRAGISETYPALGLGVDLKVFQLDLAFYGSELGFEPGECPLYNMALGLAFGF